MKSEYNGYFLHIVVNVNVIVILRRVNDEAFCRVLIYEQSWTEQQLKVGSFKFTEHVFISLLLMFCKTRSADWHSLSYFMFPRMYVTVG